MSISERLIEIYDLLEIISKRNIDIETRVRHLERLEESGICSFNFGAPTELTINKGEITITGHYNLIDTEADAATDDLDIINGGVIGDILFLSAADSARDVVLKDGTGNLSMPADMTLDNEADVSMLLFDGTHWNEVTASSNA